ncbi:MAG: hypothetical protein ACRD3H_19930 [Terriglobales bacterium]
MSLFNCTVAAAWVLAASSVSLAQSAPPVSVNRNSLVIADFDKRVDEYVKLRKRVQGGLPAVKSKTTAANIKQYELSLAQAIRAQRSQAKAGDIFTPPVSQLFRQLIATPLQSSQGGRVRASLRDAEPVHGLNLAVNQPYPQDSAMQSTPPSLLLNLPRLPADLEYRIVGRELVLLDTATNLIVDLLPEALPALQGESSKQ